MPEIITAAAKLAAIDLVAELAAGALDLAALRRDAERQAIEDRDIGEQAIVLHFAAEGVDVDKLGALVRAAVEAAGGRIEFGPADTTAEPSASRTAPGIDTQDHAPDAARDIYDEIRAERTTGTIQLSEIAGDPDGLVAAALNWASNPGRDLGDFRNNLVKAAALIAAAIEVVDRDA